MASFKAKFPVLQEIFAKNHRGAFWAPQRGEKMNGKRVTIHFLIDDIAGIMKKSVKSKMFLKNT